MSEPPKWSCEYCTYDNHAASKKCVLCRAPQPTRLITDTALQEQDIYKMASLVSRSSESGTSLGSTSGTSCHNGSSDSKKWACLACTYLNWPKSIKCTQCLTPRKKTVSSPSSSTSTATQESETPSINVNILPSPTPSSPHTPPRRTSPTSPEAAKAHNNDINKIVASQTKAIYGKWSCRACTYDNWPKALKCIICGTAKALSGSPESSQEPGQSRVAPGSPGSPQPSDSEAQAGASASPAHVEPRSEENRLRYLRRHLCDTDWLWLNACNGVVDGDATAVEAFIRSGGNPTRMLTQDEAAILNRPSALQVGLTLVHLALRFKREDLLAVLLTATDPEPHSMVKRLPSHTSPDLATDVRRHIAATMRQRKGDFPCYFLTDCVTFVLPTDILDLPRPVQTQLFDELLDKGVQDELTMESVINWSMEVSDRLGSRLYCLWNRTAGDCLLDSILQATWGVFDVDNTLRRALSDSLTEGASTFYPRWKESESLQAQTLQFTLDESQWQQDWARILNMASSPGMSLEQTHIFALAHILRRPIIVYGVKYVKSYKGETIGYAKFEGVYLPLLWERSFCFKTPIALGYTRGHFCAMVAMEPEGDDATGAGANLDSTDDGQIFLPLVDHEGKLLPLHFLSTAELGREESLLREWMDCVVTKGGLLVAVQRLGKRPPLVKQMTDEWLDYYRRLAQVMPSSQPETINGQPFSSDGESDQE